MGLNIKHQLKALGSTRWCGLVLLAFVTAGFSANASLGNKSLESQVIEQFVDHLNAYYPDAKIQVVGGIASPQDFNTVLEQLRQLEDFLGGDRRSSTPALIRIACKHLICHHSK